MVGGSDLSSENFKLSELTWEVLVVDAQLSWQALDKV